MSILCTLPKAKKGSKTCIIDSRGAIQLVRIEVPTQSARRAKERVYFYK